MRPHIQESVRWWENLLMNTIRKFQVHFLFKICIFIGEYHCSDCIHTELTSVPFSEEVDMKNTIITEVYI